ncbi:MAG: hypothetical protein II313_00845 [Anaerotignum sp.]|nr:hypothetical protein [Anaerotignum sp.]
MEILSNKDLFYEEKTYEQFNIHSDNSLFSHFYNILLDLDLAPQTIFDWTVEYQLTCIFNHACYISIVSPLILLPEKEKMTEIFTPTWGETYAMAYILLRDFHPQREQTRTKRMLSAIRNYNTENFVSFIQKYDENPFTGTLPETFLTRRVLKADILAAMNFSNITDTYNKEKITELAGYFGNMQQRNLLLEHIGAEVSQDSGIAESVKSDTLTLLSSLRLTEEPAPEEPTESSAPTAGSHTLLELQEAQAETRPRPRAQKQTDKNKSESKKKAGNGRELMTFSLGKGVSTGHITLLYHHLHELGWIDVLEADFHTLFSGKRSRSWLTWASSFGQGTLAELFTQLVKAEKVVVPKGFTLAAILQGHFKGKNGALLTRLNKGDAPNSRALPDIKRAIDIMDTSLTSAYDNDDDDYAREFTRPSNKKNKGWHYTNTP